MTLGGVKCMNKGGFIPLFILSYPIETTTNHWKNKTILFNRIAGANLGVRTIKRLKVLG